MRHIGDKVTAHAVELLAFSYVGQQARAFAAALEMKGDRATAERHHWLWLRHRPDNGQIPGLRSIGR